jgi:hypothetical protein
VACANRAKQISAHGYRPNLKAMVNHRCQRVAQPNDRVSGGLRFRLDALSPVMASGEKQTLSLPAAKG